MKKSRFCTEQIIGFIKQADAGMAVAELGRQHGFMPGQFLHLAGQVRRPGAGAPRAQGRAVAVSKTPLVKG